MWVFSIFFNKILGSLKEQLNQVKLKKSTNDQSFQPLKRGHENNQNSPNVLQLHGHVIDELKEKLK